MKSGTPKLDLMLEASGDYRSDAEAIRQAVSLGFERVWMREGFGNPFFGLTLAAADTRRIELGALIQAFPRSPMVTAQLAWDLARQSGGRFALCLAAGESHGMLPESADQSGQVGQMREYIESLRAIWDTFQHDARLRYRGQHYTFRLMAPFFNPGPIDHPAVPIYMAGNCAAYYELAAEQCQGVLVDGLHTRDYVLGSVSPALDRGLGRAGRQQDEIEVIVPVMVVSGTDEQQFARAKQKAKSRISAMAKSHVNQEIMSQLGWEPSAAISDAMLDQVAIVAAPGEVFSRARARYAGLADRVCLEFVECDAALLAAIMDGA